MTDHPENPSMGLNLNRLTTYGNGFQLLDLMKSADGWRILDFSEGFDEKENVPDRYFDDFGWPTQMPDGVDDGAVWLTRVNFSEELPTGRYVITWDGDGELTTFAPNIDTSPNRIEFDVTEDTNGIQLYIDATDTNGTGDYARNIKVFREEDGTDCRSRGGGKRRK